VQYVKGKIKQGLTRKEKPDKRLLVSREWIDRDLDCSAEVPAQIIPALMMVTFVSFSSLF
jgi:hypothetical protein